MVSKTISTSVKLAKVSDFSALLFTWIIPHTDDFGRMEGSALAVWGIVCPMRGKTEEQVEEALEELCKNKLILRYEVDGERYLEVVGFDNHQTLKNDRKPAVAAPPPTSNDGIQRNPKESKGIHSIKYLSSVPPEDIKEFTLKLVATEKEIKSKAEDLKLYCEAKGRIYKNYRSFLLNALKKDFKERSEGGKFDKLR